MCVCVCVCLCVCECVIKCVCMCVCACVRACVCGSPLVVHVVRGEVGIGQGYCHFFIFSLSFLSSPDIYTAE